MASFKFLFFAQRKGTKRRRPCRAFSCALLMQTAHVGTRFAQTGRRASPVYITDARRAAKVSNSPVSNISYTYSAARHGLTAAGKMTHLELNVQEVTV